MPARTQRTHYMGFSNRNPSTYTKQSTNQLFERSFMKSKSQYHPQSKNTVSFIDNNTKLQPLMMNTQNLNQTYSNNNNNNFNSLYKNSQKGHHHQFQSQRFNSSSKRPYMYKKYNPAPPILPLDFANSLNSQIKQKLQGIQSKQISLYKIKQIKQTFLRNNQNRKNLNELYLKYTNNQGVIDINGFNKLIKSYGFDLNQREIELVFKLNNLHNGKNNPNNQSHNTPNNSININDFVNLMTKENVYFKTLRIQGSKQSGFRFSDPTFQILRNKFSRLKQSFRVYQDQQIDQEKFQKIMKKLDITDLILKQDKRIQIFKQFTNQDGALNRQKLLGAIAVQQNQRNQKNNKQLKLSQNNFDQNLMVQQQYDHFKSQLDPLGNQIYPLNLKKTSICQYEKNLKFAKEICYKLKKIKQTKGKDIVKQIFTNENIISKQYTYQNVEKILQSEGYNFTKNQYKAFLSYLDFDSYNKISKKDFQKFVFNQNQKQIVDRLDRRKRAPKATKQTINQYIQENQQELDSNTSGFYDVASNVRSKSCVNWMNTKKSFIKQANKPQFNVPTKFSAWPQRLYQTNLSMIQPPQTTGMGISQSNRFQKNQKHSFAQQEKQKKQRIYQNRIRKTSEWQNVLLNRLQVKNNYEQQRNLSKNYNLRLLKQQYQNRCHNTVHG